MKKEEPNVTARHVAQLAGEERTRESHLSAEQLTAYQAEALPLPELEAARDHLAVCRECTRELLALPQFYELMEGAAHAPATAGAFPAGTAQSWQALKTRLGPELAAGERTPSAPAPVLLHTPRPRSFRLSPAAYAWAAGLFGLGLGIGHFVPLGQSSPAGPMLAVYSPAGAEVWRGTDDAHPLSIQLAPGAAGWAVLVFPVPPGPTYSAYRAELLSLRGEILLTAPAVPTGAPKAPLTVALAASALAPGEFRLRLVGLLAGHAEALAEKPLRVLRPRQ